MGEVVVFGIETCDQVRKARAWLRGHGIGFRFHDFRKDGLDAPVGCSGWLGRVPWDSLLNRRGLAWRKLDPQRRAAVVDQTSAAEALLADPTLIKRPVLRGRRSDASSGFPSRCMRACSVPPPSPARRRDESPSGH